MEQKPIELNSVHLLNVKQEEAALHWAPPPNYKSSQARAARRSVSRGGRSASAMLHASIPRTFKPQPTGRQTLIQPDVPPTTRVLPVIPIPQAVVWTAGEVPHQKLVPPVQQPIGEIQVQPKLAKPNRELTPSEVSLSSTPFATKAPLPAPGTTMPIVVNGPQPAKQMPQTASVDKGPSTAARVISLSDLTLQSGTAALPTINEVAPADTNGMLTPGESKAESQGTGTDTAQNGAGPGDTAGNGADNEAGVNESADNGANESGPGFTVFNGSATNSDSNGPTAPQHITLPKDGQFGMVVVGASPQENYPQTANLWTGRMVYTVYLQTETAQNWILQYSLPREHDDPPSDKLDAPWPYDMMRPNLGKYDIVLVHGYVDQDGRFDQLSVAYPPKFMNSDVLLRNLKDWAFRPAMLNGLATRVEVLLVIPGSAD